MYLLDSDMKVQQLFDVGMSVHSIRMGTKYCITRLRPITGYVFVSRHNHPFVKQTTIEWVTPS